MHEVVQTPRKDLATKNATWAFTNPCSALIVYCMVSWSLNYRWLGLSLVGFVTGLSRCRAGGVGGGS